MGEEDSSNRTYKVPTAFVLTVALVFFIGLAIGVISVKDKSVSDINDLKVRIIGLEKDVGILEDHDIEMQEIKHELFKDLLKE